MRSSSGTRTSTHDHHNFSIERLTTHLPNDSSEDEERLQSQGSRGRDRQRQRSNLAACTTAGRPLHKTSISRQRIRGTSPQLHNASTPVYDTTAADLNTCDGEHMRKLSGISKALSIPNFRHSPPDDNDSRPSSSHNPDKPSSIPLLRAHTSSNLFKLLPSQKRKPPASHSSYGIETSNGPPPSYSTQQTLSQDRAVRPQLDRGRSTKPVSYRTTYVINPSKSTVSNDSSDLEINKPIVYTVAEQSASLSPASLAELESTISTEATQPTTQVVAGNGQRCRTDVVIQR